MDFLNKAAAQLNDLFKSMTPGARVTAALLLAVVIISLGYLVTHQVHGGETYLLGGQSFTSAELSSMEAAFGKAGLSGYELDGSRVRIPAGQKSMYMAALVDHEALPAHFGDFLTSAMVKVGPFTSRQQQEELLKLAKQQELASIILSMQGMEKASVQYDSQKKSGFRQASLTTASVSVKRAGTLPLEDKQVPMIRHLVAGAFAGLSPDNVSVIDLNGRTYSGKSDGLPGASEDPYVARMREYQSMYEAQIHNALSYVPGVTVTASVELNKELHLRQEKDIYDPKAVATVMSREESTTTSSRGPAGGGRPGFEAQGANSAARLSASQGPENSEDRSTTETQNAPSRDHTLTELAGLTPKRVTVAVGVPTSYFENIWKKRNPAAAGTDAKPPDQAALELIQKEETEKIRTLVTGLLPQPAADAAAAPLVTVSAFSHLVSDALIGPGIADRAMAWLGNYWTTLGTIGLVLASIGVLRSLVRAPASTIAPLAATLPPQAAPIAGQHEGEDEDGRPKSRLRRKLGGPNLREELAEMVREDPDAAANILRGWIGSPG